MPYPGQMHMSILNGQMTLPITDVPALERCFTATNSCTCPGFMPCHYHGQMSLPWRDLSLPPTCPCPGEICHCHEQVYLPWRFVTATNRSAWPGEICYCHKHMYLPWKDLSLPQTDVPAMKSCLYHGQMSLP